MSHDATNWAVKQRGISPAAKVVLWHLCDRHHPDHGCFPSQDRLAEDCEMSRSSLNNQLAALEEAGLIRRVRRTEEATGRQKSTYYILGFEEGFAQNKPTRVQNLDTGSVSKSEPKPCPKNGDSRVQNLDTNLVREPLREPVRSACARGPAFSEFWEVWPNKVSKSDAEKAWKKLKPEDRRRATERIREWFPAWRANHPEASPIYPATYLNRRRWEDEFSSITPGKPDPDIERWNQMGR